MFKIKIKNSELIARILQRAFSVGLSAALTLSLVPKSSMVSAEGPEPGRTLSGMEVNVTVASSWADNYDTAFYDKISGEYATSYNSEETALEIGTATQLAAFAKYVNDGNNFKNKFVRLTKNIKLAGGAPTVTYINDGDSSFKVDISGDITNNWVSIGNTQEHAFAGTFDGANHVVWDLMVYNKEAAGLFGYISNAAVNNLRVKRNFVLGHSYAGSIAAHCSNSTVYNCCSAGVIYFQNTGSFRVGGLCGGSEGSTIKNCYNSNDIFSSGSVYDGYTGGLLGTGGNIINCYNSGNLYIWGGSSYCISAGGLIGYGFESGRERIIANSYNIGNIFVNASQAAGTYSSGIATSVNGTVKNLYNVGKVIDINGGKAGSPYGILCENDSGNTFNSYYDKDVAGDIGAINGSDNEANNVKGLTTAQMQGKAAKTNMVGFAGETNEDGEPLWIFEEGKYPVLNIAFLEEDDELEKAPGSSAGTSSATTPTDGINTLIADVTVNGQPQRIMVRGSYRALPQGTRLLAQVVARHADFDQPGYDIEHEIHYQITLVDESGNPLPMPLPEDVELLIQVIPGLDKSDLEVVLAQSGIDTQFDENLVEIDGKSYILVKTNHFSPYSLIDKLTDEEKAELNKAIENLTDEEKSALGAVKTGDEVTYRAISILGSVMILALGLMLNSKIRLKKFYM